MITFKNNTIKASCKDTFMTFFRMAQPYGYHLEGTENIMMQIKDSTSSSSALVTITGQIDTLNNVVMMYADKTTMSVLTPKEYVYDVVMTRADGFHMTMIYPAKFIVEEVVHND